MGQLEADSYTADRWFLSRGLPAVVHRSSLIRRLWSRSAPALAGLALIAANSVAVVAISGEHTIDIAGRPDLRQSLVLGLLAVALPLAALAGWLVSRIESPGRRSVAATAALAVIVLGGLLGGPSQRPLVNVAIFGLAVVVILLFTGGAAHLPGVLQHLRVVDDLVDFPWSPVVGHGIPFSGGRQLSGNGDHGQGPAADGGRGSDNR
jgi:hypothetical protein